HFRSHLAVQTQLRKYRLGDDNSLGVAYLSNAYVYSPHSDNNVIPARLAVSGRRGTSGTSHSCRQPRNRLNEKIRGSHDGERLSTTSPVAYFSRTPSYSAAIGTRQSIPVNSHSASKPRVSLIRQNPDSSRVWISTHGCSCETNAYWRSDPLARYSRDFAPRSNPSVLCESTSATNTGFVITCGRPSTVSTGPQSTITSGYVYISPEPVRNNTSLPTTRHPRPRSAARSSAPRFIATSP